MCTSLAIAVDFGCCYYLGLIRIMVCLLRTETRFSELTMFEVEKKYCWAKLNSCRLWRIRSDGCQEEFWSHSLSRNIYFRKSIPEIMRVLYPKAFAYFFQSNINLCEWEIIDLPPTIGARSQNKFARTTIKLELWCGEAINCFNNKLKNNTSILGGLLIMVQKSRHTISTDSVSSKSYSSLSRN